MWIEKYCNSTSKVSDDWIRDLKFNFCLHKNLIGVLVWNSLKKNLKLIHVKFVTLSYIHQDWDVIKCAQPIGELTPSVPLFLSSIPFWDVSKYCPISKNKSH